MERYLWKGHVKGGHREEYIQRHNAIWPAMVQVLKEAGIRNYSIWLDENDELTGYYECESVAKALATLAQSAVATEWEEFMADILEFVPGKNGKARLEQRQVFLLE